MLTSDEEKPFKEVLYLLLEKVRATKAAFYLLEPNGTFGLVTQYGFSRTDKLAERVQRSDPLANTIYEKREPAYVNEIKQAGRLASLMEASSSTRMLTAPLYLNSRIVGILDVRDKAGRVPFAAEDVAAVQDVLRRLALKVHAIPRFAQPVVAAAIEEDTTFAGSNRPRGSPLRMEMASAPVLVAGPMGGASGTAPLEEISTAFLPTGTARAARLVEELLAKPVPTRPAGTRGPSQREVGFYKVYLETALAFPDVEAAALTSVTPRDLVTSVASKRPLSYEADAALAENVDRVFARSGAAFPFPESRTVAALKAHETDQPITREEIAAVQSSILVATPDDVAILTLLFRYGPGAEDREALRSLHTLLKSSLAEIREAARYRDAFRGLVNKLLEPGLKRFSALKTHSFNVGRMARKLAAHVGLTPPEIEQITVAGILHDIGMKDLNYDEIYTKRSLTDEERSLVREHPRIGAFLLADVPWPYDIVPLVKHHHERWDGAGYPDGLRAEQIPFGARVIHLCEAFDAMTSPSSYRAVISVYQALDIMESKGGTQFDPELAPAFKKMVEGMKIG
jgi:HD-GYP domain-containing protein (c-di-GMP phosphodiesterase class II)